MKPIKEWNKTPTGEKVRDQFRLGWTFDKWYEKLILVVLCLLGFWRVVGMIF